MTGVQTCALPIYHIPCVVEIQTNIPRNKTFRFGTYWIAHPGFMETVSLAWNKPVKHGQNSNAEAIICQKLKVVRFALRRWSCGISRLKVATINTNKALLELDSLEDRRTLTTPERNFRRILKNHLLRLLTYQKEYWRKRCSIRWTKFGDENTRSEERRVGKECRL